MVLTVERSVDASIRAGRTWDASCAVEAARATFDDPLARRLAAGVFALAGRTAPLAGCIDPQLLAASTPDDVEQRLAGLPGGPTSFDRIAGASALVIRGNAGGLELLRVAAERALEAGAPHVAIAANFRLSQHALLNGTVDLAQRALSAAIHIATLHRLSSWHSRCCAASARLAIAAGDLAAVERLLDRSRHGTEPAIRALFAPIAATLGATGHSDFSDTVDEELRWVASAHDDPNVAACAAMAWAMAEPGQDGQPSPAAASLRRAVLRGGDGLDVLELFATAARLCDIDDAHVAVATLQAIASLRIPVAGALSLLARAHVLFRTGRNDAAAAAAGDAARAFSTTGLRGWTNEAMSLLVRHESDATPSRRRPSALSLTGRERQVAQLIRRGSSNRDVSRVLDISEHTVERHVSSILSRLGLRSRWQLVDRLTDEP